MNIGQLLIYLSCAASIVSAILFFQDGRKPATVLSGNRLAGRVFGVALASLIIASAMLFFFLLTHNFRYAYVTQYSSLNQPVIYLISAFWAGQEGTFLFWSLLVVLMALIFMRRTDPRDSIAMGIVMTFVASLTLLMLKKSPFELLPSAPLDGAGMNPLLQDPWMAIHPPILFVGYAASIFPFALVMSGLARRDFVQWRKHGFGWTLFASGTLGAGIIIGGFWAYEVLGWGGYWGWDPVENSSLVPWIILLALVHGLVVERTKGSLRRTNIALALLVFNLVLYATFLTRSGVLADFSVHSFTDLGINYYLIIMLLLGAGSGLVLFVMRFKQIKSPKAEFTSLNREMALVFSIIVLVLAGLFTFVGMSSPILTGLVGKASQVDISFYNKVNFPVAIGISLLLGITPFLGWSEERTWGIFKRLSMSAMLTVLGLAISYVAGVREWDIMLFIAAAVLGLVSNVIIAFRQYRSGVLHMGAPVSHIGVALLLVGIIGSGVYDDSTKLLIKSGETKSAYGYNIAFTGLSEGKAGKTQVELQVSDGRSSFEVKPKLYFSDYNQSMMREPDIRVFPLMDLYFSPLELRSLAEHTSGRILELTKGSGENMGGYRIEFVGFDMGGHGEAGEMAVGAVLSVTSQGTQHQVVPMMMFDEKGQRSVAPAALPPQGTVRPTVVLAGMNVEQKKVRLEFQGFDVPPQHAESYELLLDVTTKPLMMVVWTGVVLIVAGIGLAFARRLRETTTD